MAKEKQAVITNPDLLSESQKKRLELVYARISANDAQLKQWKVAMKAEEDSDMKKILPLTKDIVEAIESRGRYLREKRDNIIADINSTHTEAKSKASIGISLADCRDDVDLEPENDDPVESSSSNFKDISKQVLELNEKLKEIKGNNNKDMTVKVQSNGENLEAIIKNLGDEVITLPVDYDNLIEVIDSNKEEDISILSGILTEVTSSKQGEDSTEDNVDTSTEDPSEVEDFTKVIVNFKNFKPNDSQLKTIATLTEKNLAEEIKSDAYEEVFPISEYNTDVNTENSSIIITKIEKKSIEQSGGMSLDDALNI